MKKKIYLTPSANIIDITEEGMIATSQKLGTYSENIGEEFTQEKDMWGNEEIWK